MLHSLLFQMIDLMFVRCSLRSLMENGEAINAPPPIMCFQWGVIFPGLGKLSPVNWNCIPEGKSILHFT